MKKILLALFLFSAVSVTVLAQATLTNPKETGFLKRTVALGENTYNYRVYLPKDFNPKKKYPVVLFLHGRNAGGTDNEKQIGKWTLGETIQKTPEEFNSFIGVFPQSAEAYWFDEAVMKAIAALDQTVMEFRADEKRLYLTGYSLGGYGTFYATAKYPNKFAAIVPVAGGILPPVMDKKIPPPFKPLYAPELLKMYESEDPYATFAKVLGKMPVWIFHGTLDETVSVSEGQKMSEALQKAGGRVKFTEYKDGNHFITDKVYSDPELWKWLLKQRLGK